MANILNEDFQDFLLAFNKAQVKYVLVGGYSVIYHGFPRTTGDLDLFVEVSEQNYEHITEAFLAFGMPVFDMTKNNFLENSNLNVFSFGRPPVSIEILKEITGLSFGEVYTAAVSAELEGVSVKIINLEHLKQNKQQSGRHKDLNDLENLP
ncbi:MAG: nucleotidyltransferase [bacterium]|nr:nucleotidyltransferase [bacterium]